jgi:hypothetical protein
MSLLLAVPRTISQRESMNQFSEAIMFQRYRLMVISTWPESEAKQAAAMSAHAALEREMAFSSGTAVQRADFTRAAEDVPTSIR